MADIQYLNYGDQQIEQQALLNTLANNVQSYVAKQPWSNKRKEKFMSAYSDIMNNGLQGASNTSGQWMIDVGGTIDLDSKSKKDKEMYQEAAYFIQQQMAGLPTKSSQEKKDESELPKYDSFINNFSNYLSQTYYGGNPIRTQEDWNILDERNPNTGLRGTDKRVKKLSDYLKAYSNSLEEGKYNFEGSPFKDLTDLKTRINNAITKLDDGTWNQDDTDALNAIGLRSSDWFNNGSGDTFIVDGNEYTYGNYYGKILPAQKKAEAEAEAKAETEKQKLAQQAAYNNTLFFTRGSSKLQGRSPQELKIKYGTDDKLRQALFQYSQQNIRNLTPDEQSELHGAYRYLAKSPIDNKLLKQLQSSSSGLYKNASLNRFKKISGIDNFIWDSVAGQVIQIQDRSQHDSTIQNQDLFKGVKTPQDQQKEYLNSKIPGMTNAEWKELMAIGADITSILNPEPITAAGFGFTGAELRRQAKNETPGFKWGLGDYIGQGIDYLTGAIGAVPLAGDLVLAGKTLIKGSEVLPKVMKAFRLLGRTGAWKDIYDSLDNGGKQTASKILNGEELTVQDWRNLGQLIRGIAGHHALNRGNRAIKKTIEKSGFESEASNSVINHLGSTGRKFREAGFFGSKIKGETTVPTIKLKKTGKDGKVERIEKEITPEQKAILEKTKSTEISAKAKELLKEEIPEGYEVEVPEAGWRQSINRYKNKTSFGETQKGLNRGEDRFQNWIDNRGYLSRIAYGTNSNLENIRKGLNITSKPVTPTPSKTSTSSEAKTTNTNTLKQQLALPNKNPLVKNSPIDRTPINIESNLNIKQEIEIPKNYKNIDLKSREIIESFQHSYGLGGLKSTPMQKGFGGDAVKAGEYNNKLLKITLSRNEAKELRTNPGKLATFRGQNAKKIQKIIEQKKATDKEISDIIKDLKKKGYLKQGGTIDKQKIQRYKEFIKK